MEYFSLSPSTLLLMSALQNKHGEVLEKSSPGEKKVFMVPICFSPSFFIATNSKWSPPFLNGKNIGPSLLYAS